jgi:hypothetical protein
MSRLRERERKELEGNWKGIGNGKGMERGLINI